MELQEKVKKVFADKFGGDATLYASAGRINLIGEHTDSVSYTHLRAHET